jgi:hypothetical protein
MAKGKLVLNSVLEHHFLLNVFLRYIESILASFMYVVTLIYTVIGLYPLFINNFFSQLCWRHFKYLPSGRDMSY